MTIRVIELFAGIGAQASALERLGLDHERVAVAEFDEPTYRMYCAIHGDTPNLGDITKIEHLPECDLLTYSSPCQDISVAGHKAGLKKGSGTRSATLWDVGRLLEDMRERDVLPEVLLMENVDSILFKHAIADFQEWVRFLDQLGYTNAYQVMNAKDHGVPQNRKRLFMVSTLHLGKFIFPKPRILTTRLKDVLETNVPENYYLSPERIATFERHKKRQEENGTGFGYKPIDPERERVSRAVTTAADRYVATFIIEQPKSEGQGEPGLIQTGQLTDYNYEKMGRVYSVDGLSPTIETPTGGGKMPKIEVNGIIADMPYEMDQRVHSVDGISPTVHTRGGD